jgi:hypothetical protein
MAMFQNAESNTNQLEALLKGKVEDLADLLQVPVYHCVVQVATDEDEQPAPQVTEKTKPIPLQ